MSSIAVESPVRAAIGRLRDAVEQLQALDWDALADDDVLHVLREVETVKRQLAPVDHAAIGQLQQRSLAFTHGCRTTAVFVSNLLRVDRPEATARVNAAEALGPRRTVAGDLVEPRFPLVAAAQSGGTLSERHAQVIVRTVDKLPADVADEFGQFVEQTLVEQAARMDPRQLYGHAAALAYLLDQDGQLADDRYRQDRRGFDVHRRADGSSRVEAELTAETTEHLCAILDSLTKPKHNEAGADPRTATQRRHDAFLAVLKLVERAELLPHAGGVTTTVVLTMDVDAWVTGTGAARTGHGHTIPAAVAKRWTNDGIDARFLLALLSKTKAVQAYSSTQRCFTEQQRLALIARDGGCSFPGCDAPPAYTEVHHVTEWQGGGPTVLDNGVLACCFHHRQCLGAGWRTIMRDGVPYWIAPKSLDPDQIPRRNRRLDPPRCNEWPGQRGGAMQCSTPATIPSA